MRKSALLGGVLLASVLLTFCKKEDPTWIFPIENASFEAGQVGVLQVPDHWSNCGPEGETPPDLFESDEKVGYNVTAISEDGSRYIGMVVRSNNTRECIYQELIQPIEGTIRGELLLARSNRYSSLDRITGDEVEYNTPASMEMIGVDETGTDILLHATEPVVDTNWVSFSFNLEVPQPIMGIKLSPNFHPSISSSPYNGNVLVDLFILERK